MTEAPRGPKRPEDVGLGRLFWTIREAVIVAEAPEGRIVLWNPAAEALFGYSAKEAISLSLERLVPEPLRARHRAGIASYAATGHGRFIDAGTPLEVPALRKDGQEIAIELTLNPLQDLPFSGHYVLALVRDLTERRRTEAARALEASEAHFRVLAESLVEAVYETDLTQPHRPSGVLRYVSNQVERVFGYPLEAWYADDALFVKGLHPEDRERVLAAHADVIEHGETLNIEYRWLRPSGEVVWIEDRARVERDASGRPLVFRGTNADITARKHLERQREALLRLARGFAAEANPDVLVRAALDEAVELVGADHGLAFRWDDTQGALVGLSSTDPVLTPMPTIRPGEGASGQAAERREPVVLNDYEREWGPLAPGGRRGLRAVAAVPLLESGRLLGVLMVATEQPDRHFGPQDVEVLVVLAGLAAPALVGLERRRMEGVLLAARTTAHHLNNDLALVVGYSELLAGDPRLPDDLRVMAEEARRGAQQAAATVDKLQRVARLEEALFPLGPGGEPILDLERSAL